MDAKYTTTPISTPLSKSLISSLLAKSKMHDKKLPCICNRISVNSLIQKQSYNYKSEEWKAHMSVNHNNSSSFDRDALYLKRGSHSPYQNWRKIAWTPILYKTSVYSDKLHNIVLPLMERINHRRTPTEIKPNKIKYCKLSHPRYKIIKRVKSIAPLPIKIRSQSVCNTFRKLFGNNDETFEITEKSKILIYRHMPSNKSPIHRRKFTVNIGKYGFNNSFIN